MPKKLKDKVIEEVPVQTLDDPHSPNPPPPPPSPPSPPNVGG